MVEVASITFEYFYGLVSEAHQYQVHPLKFKHQQILNIKNHLRYLGLALIGLLGNQHGLQSLLRDQLGLVTRLETHDRVVVQLVLRENVQERLLLFLLLEGEG